MLWSRATLKQQLAVGLRFERLPTKLLLLLLWGECGALLSSPPCSFIPFSSLRYQVPTLRRGTKASLGLTEFNGLSGVFLSTVSPRKWKNLRPRRMRTVGWRQPENLRVIIMAVARRPQKLKPASIIISYANELLKFCGGGACRSSRGKWGFLSLEEICYSCCN